MAVFFPPAHFPHTRPRRNRDSESSRVLFAENRLDVSDLIWPVFVIEKGIEAVESMPGVNRMGLEKLEGLAEEAQSLGIGALAVFPCIDSSLKDSEGSLALDQNNLTCRAIRTLRKAAPDLSLICDVALDPYTDHGHDGVIRNNRVDNDETVAILTRQALVQAEAGCDTLAPSDMMDGRVGAIRARLEEEKWPHIRIMSYAAKYASAFYGPFREALGTGQIPKGAVPDEKRGYQMDPANSREALHEIALDISEGADSLIIKPGTPYLDIIRQACDHFLLPIVAYQVSGEYAMIRAAAQNGWIDGEKAMMEISLGFKRAGASAILTYFAPEIARLLRRKTAS